MYLYVEPKVEFRKVIQKLKYFDTKLCMDMRTRACKLLFFKFEEIIRISPRKLGKIEIILALKIGYRMGLDSKKISILLSS
jgi:hypothetical protein